MQIEENVIAVLEGLKFDGYNAVIEQKLDRKLYLAVDEVLQACGGKWNRRAKAHVFPIDAAELVSRAVAQGSIVTASEMGFFATPSPLAVQLVEDAEVGPNHSVLEPSAGSGRIIDAMMDGAGSITAVEFDAQRRESLRSCYSSPRFSNTITVEPAMDFLDYEASEPFDRVVMNPPFGKVGKGDHIDHVDHAYSMLDHGGTLVSVLPAGVKFRTDKKHSAFRKRFAHGTIEDLPEGSFKESGTSVRAVVLKVRCP